MGIVTKIVGIEIAVHAHATENTEKVKRAVYNLLPENVQKEVIIEEQTLEGHYNNPITRIIVKIRGKKAEEVLRYIASKLDITDRKILGTLLSDRYDRKTGRFYLRVSKQDAYLGYIRFSDGDDVIHITIIMRGSPALEKALSVLRDLGLVS